MRNLEAAQRSDIALRLALQKVESYLVDDSVVEVMLNPDGNIWVEHLGQSPALTDVTMTPEEAESLLREVAANIRVELNADSPSMLCRLPIFGARLQAIIPPVVDSPMFAMRRPAKQLIPMARYVEAGVLTERQAQLLREAVLTHKNILVGGSTGSGKTTFATSLLHELSGTNERVLLIEDYPELQCNVRNKAALLINPPKYTWRHAVMNAMRLRPDRIVVAEIVDGAALDASKAWMTGHPGGLGTIHGDNPEMMLERFAQLMEEVVSVAPRETLARTINVCVHLTRDRTNPAGRTLTGLVNVRGYDRNARKWLVEEL